MDGFSVGYTGALHCNFSRIKCTHTKNYIRKYLNVYPKIIKFVLKFSSTWRNNLRFIYMNIWNFFCACCYLIYVYHS